MNLKELMKPYKKKLALDAFVRAITFGSLLGIVSALIYSVILGVGAIFCRFALEKSWPIAREFGKEFADIVKDNWTPVLIIGGVSLAIGLFVCITIALAVYIDTYKKGVARAIKTVDTLGLEERVITMVEYQNDASYVAQLQREDAQKHLKEFDAKNIIVKAPKKKIISIVSLFLAFTIMLSGVAGAFHIPAFDGVDESVEEWRQSILSKWQTIKAELSATAEEIPEEEVREKIEDIISDLDKGINDIINNEDLDRDDANQLIQDRIDEAIEEIDKIIEETKDEELKDKLEDIKDNLEDAKDEIDEVVNESKDPAEKDEETFKQIEMIINRSDISDANKEKIKDEIKKLKEKFEEIQTHVSMEEAKKEATKLVEAIATVDKLENMVETEREQAKAIIDALKLNEITKDLGVAIEELYNAVTKKADQAVKAEAKEQIVDAMADLAYEVIKGFESPYDMAEDVAGLEELLQNTDGKWLTGDSLLVKLDYMATWFGNTAYLLDGEYKEAYTALASEFELAEQAAENGDDEVAVQIAVDALEVARQKKSFTIDGLINAINTAIAEAKATLASKNEQATVAPLSATTGDAEVVVEQSVCELEKALLSLVTNLNGLKEILADNNTQLDAKKTRVEAMFEKSAEEIISAILMLEKLQATVNEIEEEFEDRFEQEIPTHDDEVETGEIDDEKVDDTMGKIEEDIEKSEVDDETKEDLKDKMDEVEEEIKDIINDTEKTPEEKDEAIKETVNETIKDLEQEAEKETENMISLIEALKKNEITKELGEAIEKLQIATQGKDEDEIAKGEAAVTTAMNNLKAGIINANPPEKKLIEAIQAAIAETKPAEADPAVAISKLEEALVDFCTSLEAIREMKSTTLNYQELESFINDKFDESTEDIIKAVKNVESLKDVIDKIEEDFEEMTGEDIETPNDDEKDEEDKEQTNQEKVENTFGDIKDTIDKSDMTQEDKEDLNQDMGNLKDNIDEIFNDPNKTDEEKNQEANDALRDEQNKLDQEIENDNQSKEDLSNNLKDNEFADSEDETEQEIDSALKELGSAIESGDEEQIKGAMDKLENIINGKDPETGENKKDPETGEDIELTDDQKQAIADKVADAIQNAADPATPSDTRDELLDFADDLHKTQDNAESNNKTFEEQLGENFDKVEEGLNDANAETNTKQEVSDQLGDLREDLVGTTQKETEDMFDDLKNEVSKAPVSDETRNEINDALDQLDKDLNEMIQNGASKSEIVDKIEDAKNDINDMIENDKNSFLENNTQNNNNQDNTNQDQTGEERPSTDKTQDAMNNVNDAIQDANNALDKNDQQGVQDAYDKVDEAFGDLENQLKNQENGEWLKGDALKEQLGNMSQDFKDMADSLPDGELKDVYEDLSNAFQGALDKADQGDEEGAIEDATGALDDAQQKVEDILGKLEDYKNSQDNMNNSFENAQDNIMGTPNQEQNNQNQNNQNQNSQNSNQNSNQNSDQNSDQESDQESENNNQNNSGDSEAPVKPDEENPTGGGSSGPQEGTDDAEDQNYIPGLDMTIDELIASGLLGGAFDEQYLKDLTEEQRQAIGNYYASLMGQN